MKDPLVSFFEENVAAEKAEKFPDFNSGDTINVHIRIKEGDKERIQQFQGTVMQRKNRNAQGETFTVRKIASGIAVERIFPLHSPFVEKVELVREGSVRRARLYYLRGRKGRSARIKEKQSFKKENA